MNKAERIAQLIADAGGSSGRSDPRYEAYFALFNRGAYFEAHDVLEDLWLECRDERRTFFKALIQVAGGFVHVQKHSRDPFHPKHCTRLRPAARLFHMAAANLEPYGTEYQGLAVAALRRNLSDLGEEIIASGYGQNPWSPERLPAFQCIRETGFREFLPSA